MTVTVVLLPMILIEFDPTAPGAGPVALGDLQPRAPCRPTASAAAMLRALIVRVQAWDLITPSYGSGCGAQVRVVALALCPPLDEANWVRATVAAVGHDRAGGGPDGRVPAGGLAGPCRR